MYGERCYCGDEDCPSCYPGRSWRPPKDEDEEYERYRQNEIDDKAEEEERNGNA